MPFACQYLTDADSQSSIVDSLKLGAARVRERLLRDPRHIPTMGTVAAEFKETTRTLRGLQLFA